MTNEMTNKMTNERLNEWEKTQKLACTMSMFS